MQGNAVVDEAQISQLEGRTPYSGYADRNYEKAREGMTSLSANRWNQEAVLNHKADVRDAFVRNWHRANRWHLATRAMAAQMRLIEPQPPVPA